MVDVYFSLMNLFSAASFEAACLVIVKKEEAPHSGASS